LAATITQISSCEIVNNSYNQFEIIQSTRNGKSKEFTQIGPDIAVCNHCLDDLKKQKHRLNYPLINCTQCGPRFSIIKNLPYDRAQTTMASFTMCAECREEYNNINDRRFHAQPIACNNCGPKYKMVVDGKTFHNFEQILNKTALKIDQGKIIAIKGVGGFFITCDALNQKSVMRLRKLKNREGKPFAVMFRDVEKIKEFCFAGNEEIKLLASWRRPVVILNKKKKLPESISNGLNTIGTLLPYMPFHYLLFEKLKTDAIVFTSGNIADEPIIKGNKRASEKLHGICDSVVSYNRKIYNRTDDSVIRIVHKKPQLIRRSRGYAPTPVQTAINVDKILATGGELKNTFCLGRGHSAILSQHIGDLKEPETLKSYSNNITRFLKMFRVKPELMVHDLHPDYYSTRFARESGIQTIGVQHHHTHIVSCMAEHGLDEEVIGVCFDGTGLGDDGHIWGSEFFICDTEKYNRISHFKYMPLPGGDLAAKEPWRMGMAILYQVFGDSVSSLDLSLLYSIGSQKTEWLIKAISNNINCPLSSGAGRIFDAVSALLGLCHVSTFEAEAPMRLENIANSKEKGRYSYEIKNEISFDLTFKEIISDIQSGITPGIISGKFHNTIASATCDKVFEIAGMSGLKKIVLSGGVFQNKILSEKIVKKLNGQGLDVFTHSEIPANDGGISLGQLIIAAKNRQSKIINRQSKCV
jgi:hydrogenase maturation protein HypF